MYVKNILNWLFSVHNISLHVINQYMIILQLNIYDIENVHKMRQNINQMTERK